MDLRNMLNGDPPAASKSPRHPPQHQYHHHQNFRPAPPPLQPPRSPYQSPVSGGLGVGGSGGGNGGGGGGGYPQSQSPYHPSPPNRFQFSPPPPSPHAQYPQQQGYTQSPSTPHPLSAHSTVHSTTPTSSISSSPRNQFPPPQYPNQQQQQQQQHHPLHPPPSPHQYHSQHHQQQQQQQQVYPRQSPIQQSPIHSPIGGGASVGGGVGRPQLIHAGSNGVNDRSTPTISTPAARRDQEQQRERERERERTRERERIAQRERERDISISPKTRLPVYLPDRDDEPIPDAPPPPPPPPPPSLKEEFKYSGPNQNSRPNSQHHSAVDGSSSNSNNSSSGYARPRRGSSVTASATNQNHERRNIDAMDVDGRDRELPHTPGVPAVNPERKWGGSPVADRLKPNGSTGIGSGRDVPIQQLAPQQQQQQQRESSQHTQQPPPPPLPPLNTSTTANATNSSNNNTNNKPTAAAPTAATQASSGSLSSLTPSSLHTTTISPKTKDQPHQPPPITRSTPTPTNINSRPHPPPSPSPKPINQLGPPPTPSAVHAVEGSSNSPGSGGPPRKRPRRDEAPIWARKASRSSSSSPVMANRRQPSSGGPPPGAPPPQQQQQQGPHPPPAPPAPPAPPPQQQHAPQQHHQQQQQQQRPIHTGQRNVPLFGPWEPTFCNQEPSEELTRAIMDFLYTEVIMRFQNDPGAWGIIEIEAKIGHLVDRNTNERLKLPVISETVMDRGDPNWRLMFKSSMTEHQHKHFNKSLNKHFDDAKPQIPPPSPSSTSPPPPTRPPRIPMEYVHTHERDSFYELPQSQLHALPKVLGEHLMSQRFKAKVRVTTDQKTGRVMNKIVKARIADCNVYSPMTRFDWRVSVNMEMPWTGDLEGLVAMPGADVGGGGGGEGVRMKDRMSYRHLAYQIDLTQVTDGTKISKKEHELEVEVSGKEIRKHGQLAQQMKPNAYEPLVRGFVDNVRVLIRSAAPPDISQGCGCAGYGGR